MPEPKDKIEVVEVPVDKVEVRITTEDMLNALARESKTLAESKGAGAPAPEVVERLKKVNDMAQRMVRELRGVQKQDAGLFRRLERGSSVARPGGLKPPT